MHCILFVERGNWGRILGRNWGKILKSFPPCYLQSPLLTDFTPLPPLSKSGLKLVCNVNNVYGNLKSEHSQEICPETSRFMNSAPVLIFACRRGVWGQGGKVCGLEELRLYSWSGDWYLSRRLKHEVNQKYLYIQSTTVYVSSSELGLPQPPSRKRVCPLPRTKGGGGTLTSG
jgi:hypothetical protein